MLVRECQRRDSLMTHLVSLKKVAERFAQSVFITRAHIDIAECSQELGTAKDGLQVFRDRRLVAVVELAESRILETGAFSAWRRQ